LGFPEDTGIQNLRNEAIDISNEILVKAEDERRITNMSNEFCKCVFDEDGDILELCEVHNQYFKDLFKDTYIEDNNLIPKTENSIPTPRLDQSMNKKIKELFERVENLERLNIDD